MAQIDNSIYFQQQAPDILGSVQKGLSMRDMLDQRKIQAEAREKQKSVDKAFQAGIVQNPDGTSTFDRGKTLSELARVSGKDYLNAKTQFAQMDQDEMKAKKEKALFDADLISRYASGVKDQPSYEMALNDLGKQGVDTSQLPRAYDPNLVNSYLTRALSFKDQEQFKIDREKLASSAADRKEARDERRFQLGLKTEEKRAEKARPSDKQIEAFTDIDNAKSDLTNLLGRLGTNSNWTGAVDGRIPDMLVGDDQVAWRSEVGKYKDAYRKAITGAGAGPSEIAILESRLPTETDTLANFKAKAQAAMKELDRRRSTLASNLSKGGKDVSKFSDEPAQVPKSLAANDVSKLPDNDLDALYKQFGGQ